jgi:uncharacterized membrane protein
MATLSVWKFPETGDADRTLAVLERLEKEQLLKVHDAAVVSWRPGDKKPHTRQLHDTTKAGALGGAFWGLLFGLIFFVPLIGAALGAAGGALAGSLTDVGIDDGFIKSVREQVTPGTSALFLMTSDTVADRIRPELEALELRPELIRTNLSEAQEKAMSEAFSES